MRCLAGFAPGQPAGGGDPAGMAAHHLEHEHLGRSARHRGHIERAFERGHRDVLGHRAEAGAAIGVRQVVVDRLGYADAGDRIIHRGAELRDLQRRVHGIVAAVIEEIADVMRAKHLDQPLVLRRGSAPGP